MRHVAVVALFLAVAAPAGASTASRTSQTGVVQGLVTRGPGCSKQQLHPCLSPLPGVRIVFLRRGRAVGETSTNADGGYRIRLSVGLYAIRLPGRDRWQPTRVDVLGGRVMRLDIAIGTLTG